MGTGKTYSTKYLLDSNNNSGADGQVLISTSTGINWSDGTDIIGGPYLPVANPTFTGVLTGPSADLEFIKLTSANPGILMKETDTTDKNWDIQVNSGRLKIYEVDDARSVFNEYVTIGSGGNVGIGFTSPEAAPLASTRLSVNGNTYVGGTLGIGTTSPGSLLHIKGADPVLTIQDTSTGTVNASSTLRLGESGSGGVLDVYWDIKQASDVLNTHLEINHSSNGNRFTILDGGNVGIGTTSPSSTLELGPNGSLGANITNKNVILNVDGGYGTTGTPTSGQYKVIGFTGTTKDVTDITGQTSGEELKNFYLGMIGGDYFNVNRFSFWQGGDERLTIQGYGTNAGNIGINASNPTAKLHIAKTTTWGEMSNPIINIQNNGTGGDIYTAHNMGSITWKSGTVSTAEIKAVRNTPASGDNVELRFSTSNAGVQGERMTIENDGVVLINNSLGVNVTGVATGYKLEIGGGDIYVGQAVGKISLGQFGTQGDAHFGASGIGLPSVGSQDYGFYSAHNAYRTSTGAWKHSRTAAIGAVRILGSGGGSSGNAGFSFDYSANNGTSDITWTNLMHLSTGGNLQLPSYGAGILQSDGNGTITSGGNITIGGECIINDNFVNYEFDPLDNVPVQYWLLCFNSGANDVNGTLIGDRTSGHHQAMNLDVVVSAKSAGMQTGMLTSKQVLESNEKYSLVTLTYANNSYVAIKYDGHPYPVTGKAYFTGLLKSSIGTSFLLAVNAANVSAVSAFSKTNTKATIQAAKVGIGTPDPSYLLDVRDGNQSGAIARFTAINPHVIIESSTAGNSVLHFKPNTTGTKSGQFKVTAGEGYNFKWTNDAAGTGETIYMDLDTSTTGGGDLTVKGDIIAYGAPSDRKYKENIKPIESALDKAMQLQGVTFDWKDSESILDIKEDIGFIAQDVEKILPELVRDNGKGNLSLRYQGITPVLLEAIKELKAEIDLLKSKPCNCNNCNCNI